MSDVLIRKTGQVGRITLNRPDALNAITPAMLAEIDAALIGWAGDASVAMLVIDGAGDRAFCAGGDIAHIHAAGALGDFEPARQFWRQEYAMNARLHGFPKPVASFLQGFTMGGGVGVGCHASHRIVGETSRVAMPECGIGLVPDAGGSLILARAPGRLGEYLAVTGARLGPSDAIFAGFADYFIPEPEWPGLIARLEASGDWALIDRAAVSPAPAPLAEWRGWVDGQFAGATMGDVLRGLEHDTSDRAAQTLAMIRRGSPLSVAVALELVRRVRGRDRIHGALELEYRATSRAIESGDFLEGIRALIIDKDRAPVWKWPRIEALPATAVFEMLLPLGAAALQLEKAS